MYQAWTYIEVGVNLNFVRGSVILCLVVNKGHSRRITVYSIGNTIWQPQDICIAKLVSSSHSLVVEHARCSRPPLLCVVREDDQAVLWRFIHCKLTRVLLIANNDSSSVDVERSDSIRKILQNTDDVSVSHPY